MDAYTIATRASIGLIAGLLIGLTGIGGGVVLLPLLISILGVPPSSRSVLMRSSTSSRKLVPVFCIGDAEMSAGH